MGWQGGGKDLSGTYSAQSQLVLYICINSIVYIHSTRMENQPKQQAPGEEKEVDLGVLFSVFEKVGHSLLSALRSFFFWLVDGLILFLVFVKRRFLLIMAGLLLSLVPGLYRYLTRGSQYYSSMTVRANFGSVHDLYNKIDYFNSLIELGDTRKLADLFHLTEPEAAKLYRFEIDPVDDELQVTELYKKIIYDGGIDDMDMSDANPKDTVWAKQIMKYADFRKKLTEYDFPLQKITLYSMSPEVFSNAGSGLVGAVTANRSSEARKKAEDSIVYEQADLILGSLSNADTLMKAFSKKIASAERTEGSTLSISPQPAHNAEIELFDKERDLRASLTGTRMYMENHREILEVYSDFNPTGTPISPFKSSFLRYSLWCLLGTIVLLLLFEAYVKIAELEKRRRGNTQTNA